MAVTGEGGGLLAFAHRAAGAFGRPAAAELGQNLFGRVDK